MLNTVLMCRHVRTLGMKSLLTCQEMFKDVYLQSPETAHFLLVGKYLFCNFRPH
jgi:hypothetical protein